MRPLKVVAALSWYDEQPEWLDACVRSLEGVASYLVAVDGAYALYPGGHGRSAHEQADAIRTAARDAGIGLLLHEPPGPWPGNQVQKRAALLELARHVTRTDRDWLLVIDGDERLIDSDPARLRAELGRTEHDVALVAAVSADRDGPYPRQWRRLYRAIPRLTVKGAHYVYTGISRGQRVVLWGHPHRHRIAEAADLSELVTIEHHGGLRRADRDQARRGYLAAREATGDEDLDGWWK